MTIQIVAIQGTVRPGNFTAKALALVVDELRKQDDVTLEVIDPSTLSLPFPGMDEGGNGPKGASGEGIRGHRRDPEYAGVSRQFQQRAQACNRKPRLPVSPCG